MTEPELAAGCGLGNLDPQHTGGDASASAIEAAVNHPLPPAGTHMVTIRPDADAFGAMAVLAMRAMGAELDGAGRARIASIGAADRAVSGPWPGPLPAPTSIGDIEAMLDSGATCALLANGQPVAGEPRRSQISSCTGCRPPEPSRG